MKYWRASRAGNERAERAKLRAKAQLGSLSEPIFGIFLRAERARTLARLVRDFPLARSARCQPCVPPQYDRVLVRKCAVESDPYQGFRIHDAAAISSSLSCE